MDFSDSAPWHVAINEKLAAVAEAAEETPPWYDAWQLVGPESDEGQRLRVYQAVRDDGCLPAEAGFYLVAWQADALTAKRAQIELHELDERLQTILKSHGLDEFAPHLREKAPAEYTNLLQEFEKAWEKLHVEVLEEHGEAEMARLFVTDRAEFDRLVEKGRRYFHERSPERPDRLG